MFYLPPHSKTFGKIVSNIQKPWKCVFFTHCCSSTAGQVFPFGSRGENTVRYKRRKISRTSDSNFRDTCTLQHTCTPKAHNTDNMKSKTELLSGLARWSRRGQAPPRYQTRAQFAHMVTTSTEPSISLDLSFLIDTLWKDLTMWLKSPCRTKMLWFFFRNISSGGGQSRGQECGDYSYKELAGLGINN